MPRLTLTGTNIDAPDANALADFYRRASTVQVSILRQREPGQWYLLVKGVATYNCYGDPIDACRAGRIAWAFRPPLLRPGPRGGVLRRCRDSATTATHLLLPALARVRVRIRLLPSRPRQGPGPALVAVSSRSLHVPGR